jgi:hypothetical protein
MLLAFAEIADVNAPVEVTRDTLAIANSIEQVTIVAAAV